MSFLFMGLCGFYDLVLASSCTCSYNLPVHD